MEEEENDEDNSGNNDDDELLTLCLMHLAPFSSQQVAEQSEKRLFYLIFLTNIVWRVNVCDFT